MKVHYTAFASHYQHLWPEGVAAHQHSNIVSGRENCKVYWRQTASGDLAQLGLGISLKTKQGLGTCTSASPRG